ncbi:solute carrier family 2, facilitated glucose transporter member 8-like [Hylaeus anthracinus]|uniref:solute carrier family 2, facilitated glucose transporter member 8-like n=1 Tax=Hylaeus anthracinus TaxID=313031 RepID=UPI0023BA3562|nr:solute carrier family 2, facilitated glucose transporter member 8-like [Hylaeus anthracinus]XP_054005504.1 solute carrier family 2, facilitated glucose transporter member 8-like [Hylaeus anthracinus]XP_054005505.1 solute carrier family 2, facilitated glucose transporter member 8-like [Hylaeus anthracinus]
MAPTHGREEIEGRSYKEYAYSPVPASSSSAAYDSATPRRQSDDNGDGSTRYNDPSSVRKFLLTDMTEKGSTILQYVAAAAANLCTVSAGAMIGWTSPVLPNLQKSLENNPLGRLITDDESSWIGSLIALGAVIGCFAAGSMSERWGRKRTLLGAVVPFLIGWILIASAKIVIQLYVARLILGFAMAFAFTIVPMYCGEIAETSVRGALGSFLQLFITIGFLYSYSIGPSVSYVVFWILCAILPIVFFGCFATMPESPYYLLKVGRRTEAIAALARLRGKSAASVQKEADEMQGAIEEAFRNKASIADLFNSKANFKALIYTCLLVAFQQLSGINVVLFYMQAIFDSAGTSLKTSVATIIVGVVQVVASCVTPIVVDRLGRRMLLIISGTGEIVTLCALGIYFYLHDALHSDMSSISFLPILSLVIFISTYSVGWGPLPWTVMGEMFASNVKSKASGITVCVCWLLAFFITKFSNTLQNAFGNYTLYWVFSVFCLVSVLFTVFVLPETKGKSLKQIQDELNGVRASDLEINMSGKY